MKFLVDEMLGRICKWLRMLGYDATYSQDYADKYGNPVKDEFLIDECFKDYRILITRDYNMSLRFERRFKEWIRSHSEEYKKFGLCSKAGKTAGDIQIPLIYLKDSDFKKNMAELSRKLGIPMVFNIFTARCPKCNGILEEVDKNRFKDSIPPKVFKYQKKIWRCTNPSCGKLYWIGTHFKNIHAELNQIKSEIDALNSRRNTSIGKDFKDSNIYPRKTD